MKAKRNGRNKIATQIRNREFALAYLSNGFQATNAAIACGLSAKTATSAGCRMLARPAVQKCIAEEAEKAARLSGLTVERTLREVARIAYSDPRKLYDADGNLIPVHLLDDDTAATVASVEVDETKTGRNEAEVVSYTKKTKQWDKNAALDKAMKYHGLYEADNSQQKPPMLPPVLNIIAVSVRR